MRRGLAIEFTGRASDFLKIGVAAAARGDIESVREILKQRPTWIHQIGSHGRTMLWEACHKGKLHMVKYLIRRKADIDACGTHYTPYFVEVSCHCIATHKKHFDVAEYLLAKGAKYDIYSAAFLGDLSNVKKKLRQNPSLIQEGHPQYVMATGDDRHKISFVIAPADWATPLCYALRGGDPDTVKFLMERDSNFSGKERQYFIAADDSPEMVKLLLQYGANPKLGPRAGTDDPELRDVVQAYGVKGPSRQVLSEELVYLCRGDRGGNPDEVEKLLSQNADVNHQDHKGKTALHRASKSGFLPAMKILIDHGAQIDVSDKNGETALFDATRSTIKKTENKLDAIRYLLNSKANPQHKNLRDQTAMDVAKAMDRPETASVIKLLKSDFHRRPRKKK